MSTLLDIIQNVAGEIGLNEPSSVLSSSDKNIKQLLRFANRIGKDMARWDWNELVKEYIFEADAPISLTGDVSASGVITSLSSTTGLSAGMLVSGTGLKDWTEIASVDSSSQVTLNLSATAGSSISFTFSNQDFDLPSDYDRMVSDTQWDRTNFWSNPGSKSSQEWAYLKGGTISTGPRLRFRIYRNKLRITPAPPSSDQVSYEYVSNQWVTASGGSGPSKTEFTADDDTCIYHDDLMELGIKWRWYSSKGLAFEDYQQEWKDALSDRKIKDVPAPKASLAPEPASLLIDSSNLPETGYGG